VAVNLPEDKFDSLAEQNSGSLKGRVLVSYVVIIISIIAIIGSNIIGSKPNKTEAERILEKKVIEKSSPIEDKLLTDAFNYINMNVCNALKNYQGGSRKFYEKPNGGYTYTASWKVGRKRIRYFFHYDENGNRTKVSNMFEGYLN